MTPKLAAGKIRPARAIRISDAMWDAVRAEAERRNETATDVVRRALREHLNLPREE